MSLVAAYSHGTRREHWTPSKMVPPIDSPSIPARTDTLEEDQTERGGLATVLVKLLDDAGAAIYRDRDAAHACITRASALLRAQWDRDCSGYEQPPATLVQGGLAPWQIVRVKAHVNPIPEKREKAFEEQGMASFHGTARFGEPRRRRVASPTNSCLLTIC